MPNKFARHVLTRDQEEARLAMYRAGLTDRQIAAALGLTYHAVKSWRQNRGLPAHPEPRKPRFGAGSKPKVPTADPVTQAVATCDAMAVSRARASRSAVLRVQIADEPGRPAGTVTARYDSWWPIWRGERA